MEISNLWKVLTVIIALAIVWFLLSQIQISDVVRVFYTIDYTYLAIALSFFMITYVLKSLRFHFLLDRKVGLREMLRIVCVHNISIVFMPARTGEISYLYMLKKRHGISTGYGIAGLFVARVFDIFSIALLFFVSTLFIRELPVIVGAFVWGIGGVLVLMALILVSLIFFQRRFISLSKSLIDRLGLGRFKVGSYILRKLTETLDSFSKLAIGKKFTRLGLTSLGIWVCLYMSTYFLFTALSIDIGFPEVVIITSFISLLPFLPIHAFGGFGTTEITSTILLVSFGVVKEFAIVASFGVHIIGLLFTTILGLCGLWLLNGRVGKIKK
jgi:uncharacterized protein (TIRG00374 family)